MPGNLSRRWRQHEAAAPATLKARINREPLAGPRHGCRSNRKGNVMTERKGPVSRSEKLGAMLGLGLAITLAPFAPGAAAFDLDEATIGSVHQAMLTDGLTCRALVEAYLRRIEAYDQKGPKLNAIITINPDAMAIADRMDAAWRANPAAAGPLHCVPVILKDIYDTADMRTTGGSLNLKNSRPPRDAFAVRKLRDAGALILAKANLQELALGGNSVSSLQGQVLNPYDLTRTPGGSSGGTGAAIAANFGLTGTGSDTGQSIRSPSSANSLVGLRPTRGRISRRGILPVSITQDEIGPITRTVEDTARMLDVMAGYDPEDPITAAGIAHVPKSYTQYLDLNGLRGKRIGILREFFGRDTIHAEVNQVTETDIAAFKALGAEAVDVTIPDLGSLISGNSTVAFENKIALNRYFKSLGPNAAIHNLTDFIAAGGYHASIAQQLKDAEAMENGLNQPGYGAVFVKRDKLRKAILAAMADSRLDAILYPHQRRLVAKVGDEQLERNGVLSNATGFPAITLPGGFTPPSAEAPLGVPVGVELIGRDWDEGELIRMGYAFQQGTRFRKPPASTPHLP
jgi:amidase